MSEEKFTNEYQCVPVDQLIESPINPRKSWNPEKQKELEDSVRLKGILEPLLVRKQKGNGGFEVVVGGRRLRAAKKLGLKVVPVLVKDYKDEEIREIQLIENLQKEDMEPLDEAQTYQELVKENKLTVDEISERIGKNPTHVYRRYRLVYLVPEAKELLRAGKLGLMHALELCRMQPEAQDEALKRIKHENFFMSHLELKKWIEENIFLDLNGVPFKKKDAELVPEAGTCSECTKRTGSVPGLFADIKKKDVCTDPICFHGKLDAYVAQEIQTHGGEVLKISEEWSFYGKDKERPRDVIFRDHYRELSEKEKRCGYQKDAIVVVGEGAGSWKTICVDPSCKTHFGRPSSGRAIKTPVEKERIKKERLNNKVKSQSRIKLLDDVKAAASVPLSGEVLLAVVYRTFDRLWHDHKKVLANHLGWEIKKVGYSLDLDGAMKREVGNMSDKDRYRFLLEITFIPDVDMRYISERDNTPLGNIARSLNISPKEIEKEVRESLTPKGKQKELPKQKKYNPDKILKDQARKEKKKGKK